MSNPVPAAPLRVAGLFGFERDSEERFAAPYVTPLDASPP